MRSVESRFVVIANETVIVGVEARARYQCDNTCCAAVKVKFHGMNI